MEGSGARRGKVDCGMSGRFSSALVWVVCEGMVSVSINMLFFVPAGLGK